MRKYRRPGARHKRSCSPSGCAQPPPISLETFLSNSSISFTDDERAIIDHASNPNFDPPSRPLSHRQQSLSELVKRSRENSRLCLIDKSSSDSSEDLLSARREDDYIMIEGIETVQSIEEIVIPEDDMTPEMRNEQLKSMVKDMQKDIKKKEKPEGEINIASFPYIADDSKPVLTEVPTSGRGRLLRIINGYSPFKNETVSQFTPIAENMRESAAVEAMREYSKKNRLIFPSILGNEV